MKDKVKTGDLICYDSVGTLAALTKVVTNSMYSRMGLIFEAPSKYSRSNEFYVLEVTRNRDKFQVRLNLHCLGSPLRAFIVI